VLKVEGPVVAVIRGHCFWLYAAGRVRVNPRELVLKMSKLYSSLSGMGIHHDL